MWTVSRKGLDERTRTGGPAAGRAGPAGRVVPLRTDPGGDRSGVVDAAARTAGACTGGAGARGPVRGEGPGGPQHDRPVVSVVAHRRVRRAGAQAGSGPAAHSGRGVGPGGGVEEGEPGPYGHAGGADPAGAVGLVAVGANLATPLRTPRPARPTTERGRGVRPVRGGPAQRNLDRRRVTRSAGRRPEDVSLRVS